jgi:hypothetical protein
MAATPCTASQCWWDNAAFRVARNGGADLNDFDIADNYADPKAVWLTANDTTIYAVTNVDLGKSGPVVVTFPPGLTERCANVSHHTRPPNFNLSSVSFAASRTLPTVNSLVLG